MSSKIDSTRRKASSSSSSATNAPAASTSAAPQKTASEKTASKKTDSTEYKNLSDSSASTQRAPVSRDSALDSLAKTKQAKSLSREHGMETYSDHSRTFRSESQAKAAFEQAAAKLTDVNSWKDLGPSFMSTDFKLHDQNGRSVRRAPQEGDFLKINLPGPDGGPDWVRIEKIEKSPDKLSIVVRPSHDPSAYPLRPDVIAHFFTKDATNTFTLERQGKELIASVHGRNELPNLFEAGGAFKAMRNSTIAAGGWGFAFPMPGKDFAMGAQKLQWTSFTEKLLED